MTLDAATPLIGTMQDLAKQGAKAGYPRAENGAEMMTERARDRAQGKGAFKQNDLFHGRRMGKRGATFGGKQ